VTPSHYVGSSTAQFFAPSSNNPLPKLAEHSGLKEPFRRVECWELEKKTVWEFPEEKSSFSEDSRYEDKMARCINFNNEGVTALNNQKYELAITKFLESLKLDDKYQIAYDNLAITYNHYGLALRERPKEALKLFHLAFCLKPSSQINLMNIEGIIRVMGMDPNAFNDRITLAEQATTIGDLPGSVVEYQAALKIKDDPSERHKLIDALKKLQDGSDQLPLRLVRPSEREKALAREPFHQ
jgi:tetratricopeptide (TPR) repeat protein